jgi:phage-related protein/DNA-binding XRE family transcriptional regulator
MSKLGEKEKLKIRRALLLFSDTEKMPSHFIKYIEDDDIYEFRVSYGNNEFRIFFIYDGDKLVILFNAFKKKTQKTPQKEIAKAKRLKKNIMTTKMKTYNVSEELNQTFGALGTESRRRAEEQAWEEYNAQILLDARKESGLTQSELAEKIGADKSYISRVERGLTVLSISTFYRMVSAMGLSVELK